MLGHIEQCEDFFLDSVLWPEGGTVFQIFGTIFGDHDLPDPAWVLVQKNRTGTHRKFRDATGVIAQSVFVGDYTGGPVRGDDPLKSFNVEGDESVVNFEDYPDVHDTHDQNFYLKLDPDPSQADLISSFGIDSRGYTREDEGYYAPDTLEVEWETGILTRQFAGDGRFFPKWAWPVPGDRVWVNGYWTFDCGHPVEGKLLPPHSDDCPFPIPCREKGLRTEIHPARAIASMRQQLATPPAGGPPIPVTATDVYIHGRSGVIVDLLECGGRVIVDNRNCPTRSGETPRGIDSSHDGGPGHDIALDHLGTPINEDFQFTICAPPRPVGTFSVTVWEERVIPDDTVGIAPAWEVEDAATGACHTGSGSKQVQVTLRLGGTNVTPDSVYARRIYVGWAAAPIPLRHLRVRVDSFKIKDDTDDYFFQHSGPDTCECPWFWSSIDRAPNEILRLADLTDRPGAMIHMNNGDEVTFTNATWDFFVPDDQSFTIRTFGFDGGVGEDSDALDQDCLDDHFGHHDLGSHVNISPPWEIPDFCYLGVALYGPRNGTDDPFDVLQRVFSENDMRAMLGPWPSTGVAQIRLESPRRCLVEYERAGFRLGEIVRCDSEQQLRDALEERGYVVTSVEDGHHQFEMRVTIEELPADSDGDGLNDTDEVSTHHTDPLDSDTDNDGLTDGAELNTYHTDPLDPDTDDDQLPDGVEVSVGTDPLDADSDGDGIPDGRDPQFIVLAVNSLPDSAFRTAGNRTSILDVLAAVEKRIDKGQIDQAIRELNVLLTAMDGCGTAADSTDWIVDCTAQVRIRELVSLLVANLGA
jgi:hypothetical protein